MERHLETKKGEMIEKCKDNLKDFLFCFYIFTFQHIFVIIEDGKSLKKSQLKIKLKYIK